jgi:hypothetical protein
MFGGTMRRLAAILLACAACRPGTDAERAAELRGLCEDYCPRRIECVADGWAKGDVEVCTRMCVNEERYALATACGEASFALLECMAAVACEDLPAAVAGLVSDGTADCFEEQEAQREACSFEIVR